MSIEAIHWALNAAPIPRDRRDASSLAMVLVGLANHADPDGCNAFPSLARLAWYTRLSERSVRYALRALEELGLIRSSDPEIVAAYVKRADRRPNGYNLAVHLVDKSADEGQSLPPVEQREGQTLPTRGANSDTTRGKACPRTFLNRQGNRPAPEARSPLLPPCGQCDARPDDPVSARVVWLDADRTRSTLCPRCHPSARRAGGAR
ncbi:helix-turn-helix domain-containing protein [Amycolatopsis sp. NPDC052450]|uniref:helix-turn-helix domain-containing protein n=1 Tax=Amycolatopsis sp. NPDC052450 TaxID=3363937 RepID=UPI0037C5273C